MGKLSKAFQKRKKGSYNATKENVLPFSLIREKPSPNQSEDGVHSEGRPVHNLDPILMTFHEPNSIWAEQFRLLKTQLLFPTDMRVPRMIMVTSALPGEGKSVIAANLAISIAQNVDEKVFLIDCDLRRPTVHKLFGMGRITGLSDFLLRKSSLHEILMDTPLDGLKLVTSGRSSENSTELITSPQMMNLLSKLRDHYNDRFIILDAAPPAFAAEANALVSQTDGVLLTVKYGSTGRQLIANVVDLIGKKRMIGVVLNWFQKPFISYRGYHRYA